MPANDFFERRELVADEGPVIARVEVVGQRLEEPEGGVDRVVLGHLAGVVEGIGQHTLVQVTDEGLQDAARFVRVPAGEREPAQADHGVAPPVGEPRIARDDGSLHPAGRGFVSRHARDADLAGGERQLARDGRGIRTEVFARLPLHASCRQEGFGRGPSARDWVGPGDDHRGATWIQWQLDEAGCVEGFLIIEGAVALGPDGGRCTTGHAGGGGRGRARARASWRSSRMLPARAR